CHHPLPSPGKPNLAQAIILGADSGPLAWARQDLFVSWGKNLHESDFLRNLSRADWIWLDNVWLVNKDQFFSKMILRDLEFPDKPITVRPTETRMGSGKGSPEYWVAVVKPSRIVYEMGGVAENIARKAISITALKMPIRTQFIISG
ncbi:hypothetical protein Lal_00014484, partial [Lupinus albus]